MRSGPVDDGTRRASALAAVMWMAANDLRQRLRDWSFLIFGLLVPFALAFVFSLLIGPLERASPVTAAVVLADEDVTVMSMGMRTALAAAAEAGVVTWTSAPDEAEARRRLEAGEADAAVVLRRGFGAAVAAAARTATETTDGADASKTEALGVTVVGRADRILATQIARGVTTAYVSRIRSGVWAASALGLAGHPVTFAIAVAQVAGAPDPLTLVAVKTSDRQLGPTTYYAAGMAVFFVFFIVQLGVMGLLDEERHGTLARLLAAPVARGAVLAAKVLSSVVIGVVSMVTLAVASTLIMGAEWGAPLGAFALILAVVASAAGILMLVAGLARSSEAAGNVQAVIAITLGALGGTFFPLPQTSGVMEWLPKASPHHWFMRGMGDLAAGGGVAATLPSLAALALFAFVTGAAGWALLARRLNR